MMAVDISAAFTNDCTWYGGGSVHIFIDLLTAHVAIKISIS